MMGIWVGQGSPLGAPLLGAPLCYVPLPTTSFPFRVPGMALEALWCPTRSLPPSSPLGQVTALLAPRPPFPAPLVTFCWLLPLRVV